MRRIDVPSIGSDIARAIRRELTRLRDDPATTLEWLSVAAYRLEQAAIAGQAQILIPAEDEVMINSNLRWVNQSGHG